ncbi:hypothetical protein D0867_14111 [Hortaea werneckii]|uniref:Uncharacterized protein n=1 Tax=Hortaea werneckii TaxID=91943 RepID=A0A3M6XSP9_HORWE|nr:hypothetical protein D0867_14111 [Hortaea werneckii]RMY25165.1 hypothetical protein D0866_11194 [Hortaea werneckii]
MQPAASEAEMRLRRSSMRPENGSLSSIQTPSPVASVISVSVARAGQAVRM